MKLYYFGSPYIINVVMHRRFVLIQGLFILSKEFVKCPVFQVNFCWYLLQLMRVHVLGRLLVDKELGQFIDRTFHRQDI